MEAALEVCRPENITWPTFACRLLRLWHDEGLHNDMHDSVIDCIIECLRSRRRRRWAPAVLINALYCSVEAIERESLIGTNFTLHTKLRDLLATLYLHHLKEKLMSQERISIKERRLLNLKDDIRIVAMSLLLDAATEEDFKLPKDILADDFHQHCRYHVHGTNERCLQTKAVLKCLTSPMRSHLTLTPLLDIKYQEWSRYCCSLKKVVRLVREQEISKKAGKRETKIGRRECRQGRIEQLERTRNLCFLQNIVARNIFAIEIVFL